jgi:hypothetical protein
MSISNQGLLRLYGVMNRITTVSGTVAGGGTIQGNTTVGTTGKFSPDDGSNKPGQITIQGGLDIGGTLIIDIGRDGQNHSNENSQPGTGFDTIPVEPPYATPTQPTNITARGTLTVNLRATNTDLTSAFWTTSRSWTILSTTNGTIVTPDGLPPGSAVVLFDDFDVPVSTTPYGSFAFAIEALSPTQQNLNVVWTPVPEPAAWVFGLVFLAWTGLRRRSPSGFTPNNF